MTTRSPHPLRQPRSLLLTPNSGDSRKLSMSPVEAERARRQGTYFRRYGEGQSNPQDLDIEGLPRYNTRLIGNIRLLEIGLLWLYHDGDSRGLKMDRSAFDQSVCTIVHVAIAAAHGQMASEPGASFWLESPTHNLSQAKPIQMSQVFQRAKGGPHCLADTLKGLPGYSTAATRGLYPDESMKSYCFAYSDSLMRVHKMVKYTYSLSHGVMHRRNVRILHWADMLLGDCITEIREFIDRRRF